MIRTNEAYAYWTVPVNSSGIPGNKSTGRPVNSLGPDGTADDGVTGTVLYEPFSDKYSMLSLRNISVVRDLNIAGVDEIHLAALIIDESAPGEGVLMGVVNDDDVMVDFPGGDEIVEGDYVVWNDSEDSGLTAAAQPPPSRTTLAAALTADANVLYVTDPSSFPQTNNFDIYFGDGDEGGNEGCTVTSGAGTNTFTITRGIQGSGTFHAAGTEVLWFPDLIGGVPQRRYECNQVVADPPGSGTLKLLRHYPPDPRTGMAYFESFMTPHEAGKRVYKLQVRHFSIKTRKDALYTNSANSGLPDRVDVVIPSACVVATLVSLHNYYGYGPWTTYNCSYSLSDLDKDNPPAPGLRTLAGQSYFVPVGGDLEVETDATTPLRIQDAASIRCVYAEVEVAPSGGPIVLRVKLAKSGTSEPDWEIFEELTILAGKRQSFDPEGENTPSVRRMPYSVSWPPTPLAEDMLLGVDITQVGTSVAGNNLVVYLQT